MNFVVLTALRAERAAAAVFPAYQLTSVQQNPGFYSSDDYKRNNPVIIRNSYASESGHNSGFVTRINPRTGLYERVWNDAYAPYYDCSSSYRSRYNLQTGRYERVYYPDADFGRRCSAEHYGRGSVASVHVPRISYANEGRWNILRDVRRSHNGNYHYSYETENGIRAAEDSHQINRGTAKQSTSKTGFYEYVGDDGKTYRVDWVADENGFRATVRCRLLRCGLFS